MTTMLKPVLAAILATVAAPASAAAIYSEDFDSYTPGLNFVAFNPPGSVSDGTVDVVASGSFSIDCVGDTGNCLDLDGSTGNSGIFRFVVDLAPGDYVLSFAYSGNQRGGASDTLFVDIILGGPLIADSVLLAADDPFEIAEFFLPLVDAITLTVEFYTDSNDNIGPILDSIRLTRETDVPEPAMLGLLGLGLIGLGAMRRRA